MSIVVTFAGRTPLPTAGSWYPIWSSRVQSSSPADLRPGQRLALALPADVDLRDPALFPGVPAPDGAFAEAAPAPGAGTRAGRVTGTGPQTLSFVAPPTEADRDLLLVVRDQGPGRAWTVTPFPVRGCSPRPCRGPCAQAGPSASSPAPSRTPANSSASTGSTGGGVRITMGSAGTVERCVIKDNVSRGLEAAPRPGEPRRAKPGGGISVRNADLTLTGTRFTGSITSDRPGGGIVPYADTEGKGTWAASRTCGRRSCGRSSASRR
ncbi:hypothetical protein ACFW6S_01330 [Streptomyces sp. NPDC058740]|uniref:hypothetical protein n=1 Tax=Streptomyces sp. NPDC058740 TaxID=3346619 RepID=UPI0036A11C5F